MSAGLASTPGVANLRPAIVSNGVLVLLMRIGPAGAEKPAARVGDDSYVDLSDLLPDFDEAFFASGALAGLEPEIRTRAAAGETRTIGEQRIGAPIARPHQIVCIGLNYSDHAAETGATVPP